MVCRKSSSVMPCVLAKLPELEEAAFCFFRPLFFSFGADWDLGGGFWSPELVESGTFQSRA